jgi:acetate kinase
MKIAVINSGSSSIKFKLFDMETNEVIASKFIERICEKSEIKTHEDGLMKIFESIDDVDAIAHRVVHGGEKFHSSIIIDDEVTQSIKELIPLAPLHNPANLLGIEITKKMFCDKPQVAVFDTSFHYDMPREAFLYAIPYDLYEDKKIRRYGFHGTSYSYVLKEASKLLDKDINELNVIAMHLGNGASICAIKNGKSIDTSMGFTPLEGLVMGSRSGDVDAGIVFYLEREVGMDIDEIDRMLNKHSGLLGVCKKNDMREILASEGEQEKLAIEIMVRRVQKYIGSYMVLLENVDAIIFTGGIGENSSIVREKIMDNKILKDIKTLVIKTDEEREIANECYRLVN